MTSTPHAAAEPADGRGRAASDRIPTGTQATANPLPQRTDHTVLPFSTPIIKPAVRARATLALCFVVGQFG